MSSSGRKLANKSEPITTSIGRRKRLGKKQRFAMKMMGRPGEAKEGANADRWPSLNVTELLEKEEEEKRSKIEGLEKEMNKNKQVEMFFVGVEEMLRRDRKRCASVEVGDTRPSLSQHELQRSKSIS